MLLASLAEGLIPPPRRASDEASAESPEAWSVHLPPLCLGDERPLTALHVVQVPSIVAYFRSFVIFDPSNVKLYIKPFWLDTNPTIG